MNHSEENMQMSCVKWFGLQYPRFSLLLHHSPNGGFRNQREAARFKAMGTRAGFPDLLLLLPRHGFHYLALELKVGKNTQTDRQRAYQTYIETTGGKYVVIRSLDQFIETINDYLKPD